MNDTYEVVHIVKRFDWINAVKVVVCSVIGIVVMFWFMSKALATF